MRKTILIFSLSLLGLMVSTAQNVGINSSGAAPDGSAMLDVVATDKGVLIPRVDISDLTTEAPVTSATTSLLVYNTNTTTGPGYFYWDGSIWVKLFDNNDGKPWRLLGNAGTVAGTNFLGTTDAVDLVFKANNIEQARILSGAEQGIGIPNSLSIWGRNNADDAWIRAILPAYTDDDIYIGSGANPSGTNIHIDAGGIAGTALFVQGSNGYVGIGTTAPYQKLQVTDDILMGGPSDGSSTADGNAEGVKIWNDNSAWFFGVDRSNDEGDTQTDENFFIGHNDDSDNEGIFNIQYSGNIGMGTITPGYPLTVTSPTANITGAFFNTEASTDNYAVYGDATTTDYYGYGGYFISGYIGAYGRVNPTGSGSYTGVRGYVSGGSGNNYGFRGYANGTGADIAVYGYVDGSNDFGLYGYNNHSSGTGIFATGNGVTGSYLVNGTGIAATGVDGIYGKGTDATGTGVIGVGNNAAANTLADGSGVSGSGTECGVYGNANSATGSGILGQNDDASGWSGNFQGNTNIGISTSDVHNFWGTFQSGSTSDSHVIVPQTNDYGYVGTSSLAWFYMYSYNFVDLSQRKLKRNINSIDGISADIIMNDIEKMKPSLYKYKNETDVFIKGNEAKYRPNAHLGLILDEVPDYMQDNAFSGVDIYALGTVALTGVKYNRESIKKLQEKISDFGSENMNSSEIWINFDNEFSSKLSGVIPVVTVSSNNPSVTISITEKNSNGFKVVASQAISELNIDWIAMAKVEVKTVDMTDEEIIEYKKQKQLIVSDTDKNKVKDWDKEKTDRLNSINSKRKSVELNKSTIKKEQKTVDPIKEKDDTDK